MGAVALLTVLLAGAAQAATAGHLFKSTLPVVQSEPETIGSIGKPAATGDVTGSIKKPATKRVIKPKPGAEH
jgi:hypothetical protein